MEMVLDVIYDTLIDGLRILPFLFLTYLAMECLEHWTGAGCRRSSGSPVRRALPSAVF